MAETLNLVNPKDSLSCSYEISRFPDGQQSVKIIETNLTNFKILSKQSITIKSRLNTFQDLELIICANQALKELGVENINLYIPYCIGGRSDRKFQEGGVNYIKQVIAPILNSQNFKKVKVLDPHSDVLEACINNFVSENNYKLVKMALTDIDNKDNAQNRIVLVSPDAGAYKKVFGVGQNFGIENIITASKVRDVKTGKILSTELPSIKKYDDTMKYVIVDDICDGGRTFIELAKEVKKQKPDAKIYLVVTHGIFSAGFDSIMECIDGIYTTNSVKDIEGKSYVKQLNVF